MLSPFLRMSLDKSSELQVNRWKLPLFYDHDDKHWMTNYNNSQIMKKPSDIVFITDQRRFNSLGRKMKNAKLEYKLRLSKSPIRSSTFGEQQQVFWTLFGQDSMLHEPLSNAFLILLVQLTSS